MSNFSIRIQLLNAEELDYETLDRSFVEAGFSKELRGKDSTGRSASWSLPIGEYDYSSDTETAPEVRDKVKDLVDDLGKRSWIVVTEVKARSWSLKRAKT